MFTGIFRVKGGGRFMANFLFSHCRLSVVVVLLGVFSFTAILRSHFLLDPLDFQYPMNSPHYYSRFQK